MKIHTSHLEEPGFCHTAQSHYIHIGCVNLGTNYTYQQFINSCDMSELQEIIRRISIEDSVTLIGSGIYGKVLLKTCASDLWDHTR